MQAALADDFPLRQEDGFFEEAAPIVLYPEDSSFRRGQEDGAREAGHFQVVEVRVVGGVLRLRDHCGDKAVPDAVLEGFDIEFPDDGGGADVGREVRAIFGERRFPVGQERNLGEGSFPEMDGPGLPCVQQGAQRDGLAVRSRAGAGEEVVGGQVAVERHLGGGDAAVPDGVRDAGIRARLLAARGGDEEDGRNQESCCSAHDQGFKENKSAPRTLRGGVTKNPEKTRGRALSGRRAPVAQTHRVQMGRL